MREPAGNNIKKKKSQQPWLPLLLIYSCDLGLPLLLEVEARVHMCVQKPRPWTCPLSTLENSENATPGKWNLRQSPLPIPAPGWDAWNQDTQVPKKGQKVDIPTVVTALFLIS